MVRRAPRARSMEALDGLGTDQWLTVAGEMRWWGWGDPAHPPGLPAHALCFLPRRRRRDRPRPPWRSRMFGSPPSSLDEAALAALREIVGAEGVRGDHPSRVLHAGGKGYPDLVRMRAGEPEGAPDAVVLPGGHDQVRAVLELCARRSLAVVPFGGGTSVVGGVAPLRGSHAAVIALDTAPDGGGRSSSTASR